MVLMLAVFLLFSTVVGVLGLYPFVVSLGHRLAAWLFIWGVEMVSGGTYCGELVSH